jgi:hypothetical protein
LLRFSSANKNEILHFESISKSIGKRTKVKRIRFFLRKEVLAVIMEFSSLNSFNEIVCEYERLKFFYC